MKLVFVAFVCFAYQQASTQFVGLNNCPKATSGNPKPPAAGKYYQVVRFKLSNLPEIPKCRNFKLTVNANKSLLISQSVVGPFEVVLNQTFIAKANASGYWDVSENGESMAWSQNCNKLIPSFFSYSFVFNILGCVVGEINDRLHLQTRSNHALHARSLQSKQDIASWRDEESHWRTKEEQRYAVRDCHAVSLQELMNNKLGRWNRFAFIFNI